MGAPESQLDSTKPFVSGALLAAGESKRFEGPIPKQLINFEGEPMVRRIARQALVAHLAEVIVVVGYMAASLRQALSGLSVKFVDNPNYSSGQSSSVRRGLQSLDPLSEAALFIPADQPFLTSALMNRLIEVFQSTGKSIVLPSYQGRRGAPVLFGRSLFSELAEITGELGGRQIFKDYETEIITVTLDSEKPLIDIDTREDYQRWIESPSD